MAQTSRNRRSDVYKAVLVARGMAERLSPISDDLALLLGVGEKTADQVPVEGMVVEQPPATPEDDFTVNLDIPEFKQYASVFNQYPYVEVRETESFGRLVVLGYCAGRGKHTNKLYRRNCTIVHPDGRRQGFKDIGSAIGVLKDTGPDGTHYTIKAIPYKDYLAVKCWTNIVGEGDLPEMYRYLLIGESAITQCSTEATWESLLAQHRGDRKKPSVDFTPEPPQSAREALRRVNIEMPHIENSGIKLAVAKAMTEAKTRLA
jgi:hypothetical protein